MRTEAPCPDRIGLLNVILAEGISLALRKMADASSSYGFLELLRISRWHVDSAATPVPRTASPRRRIIAPPPRATSLGSSSA
nr:hypothetical protein [Cereibacter sphaeroides]